MAEKNRTNLNLKQKHKILCELDQRAKQTTLALKYNVSLSTITNIKANREKIMNALCNKPVTTKKLRESDFNVVDTELFVWFQEQRERKVILSGYILKEKADKIAKEKEIKNFKCTQSWIERFKRRHSISFKTISGESQSVKQSDVDAWLKNTLPEILKKYKIADIFNGDESGLFFAALPNKTLALKKEVCKGGKVIKERLTVLLCASMSGEKRPPIIIGKHLKPRCFKNKKTDGLHYHANKSAWMKSDIFKEELMKWDNELRIQKRKILLLIDRCPAHPDISELLSNIELCFLPANTTSVLQPMDAGIIKNFKVQYRKSLIFEVIKSLDKGEEFKPNIYDAIHMIRDSWELVAKETIKNCFSHAFNLKALIQLDEIPNIVLEEEEKKRAEDGMDFFISVEDFNNYVVIDEDIDVYNCEEIKERDEINIMNENEENLIEKMDDQEEKKEITTGEALDSIKSIKNFLNNNNLGEGDMYCNILKVEQEIVKIYCAQKTRQKKITDYLIKK